MSHDSPNRKIFREASTRGQYRSERWNLENEDRSKVPQASAGTPLSQAQDVLNPVDRRRFLQLMGASLALAGATACTRQPEERIVPYVRAPEEVIPGKSLFFATAMPQEGYGLGLIVESHDGRPTKIEGNPQHPASLGAANLLAQASILNLYDPERTAVITSGGRVRTWDTFLGVLKTEMERFRLTGGEGLRILSGTTTSPTMAEQLDRLLDRYPQARWHSFEPVGRDAARQGSVIACGQHVNTYYRLAEADVVVSLDADFLFHGPAAVRYAKDLTARRRVEDSGSRMNRVYMVESSPTNTGTVADHRLGVRSSEVAGLALFLAHRFGLGITPPQIEDTCRSWLEVVAQDLMKHRGNCAIIPGDFQPPLVHALVHWMNGVLSNHGSSVIHTESVEVHSTSGFDSLAELVEEMEAGSVQTLIILGGNPVYNAPADLHFAERLEEVGLRIHLTSQENETSKLCHWLIPESHYLEAWSDVRAFEGTVSVIQPLIEPLYRSRSKHEILAAILGKTSESSYEIVRNYWRKKNPGEDFERIWRRALHDGTMPETALPPREIILQEQMILAEAVKGLQKTVTGLEIMFRPDPSVYDGTYCNNAWLQELPKPLTKLTWDNAALISPTTAAALALSSGQVVELTVQGRAVRAPIWIQPGHPRDAVTLHLGYGRETVGSVGRGLGFNAYPLRTSTAPWSTSGARLAKTGETYPLVSTQDHSSMERRHLVRRGTVHEFQVNPGLFQHDHPVHAQDVSLYRGHEYTGYAWGMAIDLNACTGCNACVLACQAENNIAVVGKDEVANGREMHWIRIDRYYSGASEGLETIHQPVMCQHCENAPCESVCPVAATVHSDEGLNDMVYNRCVGTRYCSNNCPYKVRRFNFLLYSDWDTPSLKMQRNPNVTVRSRGVMEKCSYCLQRINAARIQAGLEDREVSDGEIRTACQQTCPADAIVFGNINDPDSRVAKLKASQRNYGILTELKTEPRTSYLAILRNPNLDIET